MRRAAKLKRKAKTNPRREGNFFCLPSPPEPSHTLLSTMKQCAKAVVLGALLLGDAAFAAASAERRQGQHLRAISSDDGAAHITPSNEGGSDLSEEAQKALAQHNQVIEKETGVHIDEPGAKEVRWHTVRTNFDHAEDAEAAKADMEKKRAEHIKQDAKKYSQTVSHNFREDPDVTKARHDQMLAKQTKNLVHLMNHQEMNTDEDGREDASESADVDEGYGDDADVDEGYGEDAGEDAGESGDTTEDKTEEGSTSDERIKELKAENHKLSSSIHNQVDATKERLNVAHKKLDEMKQDNADNLDAAMEEASAKGQAEADKTLNEA